jgi:predicted nucleic acid-binding protein
MSSSAVIDDSALVMALTDVDPIGVALRARLHDVESLNAPTLLEYELLSALFGMRRGGKLIDVQVERAINSYKLVNIIHHRMFDFWKRAQELSYNLSAYDAQYVALAEALDLPLITCDARIARSGAAKCAIEVFA